MESNLEKVCECVEEITEEHGEFIRQTKEFRSKRQAQAAWRDQRVEENRLRVAAGKDTLPDTDPSLELFKPIVPSSRFPILLGVKQLKTYCEQSSSSAGRAMEKLHLASALSGYDLESE